MDSIAGGKIKLSQHRLIKAAIVQERNETKQTAYENGLLPGASFVESLGGAISDVGGVIGTLTTGIPMTGNSSVETKQLYTNNPALSPAIIFGAGIVLLVILLKK